MKIPLLRLDLSGGRLLAHGWNEELFETAQRTFQPPALNAFAKVPAALLDEYHHERAESYVGRIMGAARRLQGRVDRLVILASEADSLPAKALFQAACHPFHNEQSRGERAGYPRIYFAGDSLDNDALQGLLFLLQGGRKSEDVDDAWGLIVLQPQQPDATFAALQPIFQRTLRQACGEDERRVAERMIVVHANDASAQCAAEASENFVAFPIADVDRCFNAISGLSLIPAACMGLDILRFLQGAWKLQSHFEEATTYQNEVVRYRALNKTWAQLRDLAGFEWRLWCDSLAGFERWYRRLAGPAVGETIRLNLMVDQWRCDPVDAIGEPFEHLLAAARQADKEAHRPAVDLVLPSTHIGSLGQLFQFLQLATALEEHA